MSCSKFKAAFTLCALVPYSLNTSVITPFFKVPPLGFGHVNGHRALCTHRFVFSGAVWSAALYSMLSLRFEMASDRAKWSNYVSGTQGVNTPPFFASTKALIPNGCESRAVRVFLLIICLFVI